MKGVMQMEVAVVVFLSMVLVIYSLCAVAGRCSRTEERHTDKNKDDGDDDE